MGGLKKWLLGLRGKFLVLAILPMVGFAVLTVLAISSSNRLGEMLNSTYQELVPGMDAYNQLLTTRMAFGYNSYAAVANAHDPKARDHYIEETKKYFEKYKELMNGIASRQLSAQEKELFSAALSNDSEYVSVCGEILTLLQQRNKEADDKAINLLAVGGRWHNSSTVFKDAAIKVIEYQSALAKSNNLLQAQLRHSAQISMMALSTACAVLIFLILMVIAHRVSSTISEVSSSLKETGGHVAQAISQLSIAGQSLSEASTRSAASLEETVASLDVMGNQIQRNSESSREAAKISLDSKSAAEQGEKAIRNLMSSMHEISNSSKKIEEITNVIDDIAFQTNLLALNAAVEAARAGEQGKGFAVVAEAVRTLAQRSAIAAKDISQLIQESADKVEKGRHVADDSGEALTKILSSVQRVSVLNGEIAEASGEQQAGITEINRAMTQLDQGVQANAASSEEIAATTVEISSQTEQMQVLVARLNKMVVGNEQS